MQSLATLSLSRKGIGSERTNGDYPIQGFPDAGDRSPNEPNYLMSAKSTRSLLVLVDESGDHYHSLGFIYDYAICHGWKDVLLAGKQLLFISDMVQKDNKILEHVERSLVIPVTFDGAQNSVSLLRELTKIDCTINHLREKQRVSIDEVSFVLNDTDFADVITTVPLTQGEGGLVLSLPSVSFCYVPESSMLTKTSGGKGYRFHVVYSFWK